MYVHDANVCRQSLRLINTGQCLCTDPYSRPESRRSHLRHVLLPFRRQFTVHLLRFLLLLNKNGVLVNFLELGLINLLTFHLYCLVHLLPNRSLPSPSILPRATRGGKPMNSGRFFTRSFKRHSQRTQTGPDPPGVELGVFLHGERSSRRLPVVRVGHFFLLRFSTCNSMGKPRNPE